MMSTARTSVLLTVLLAVAAAVYLFAACRQKEYINLSATAGGQYPYLQNAKLMAQQGVTHYLGDRNRMPLVPALVSFLHTDDWKSFVDRASWFAIVSSFVLLAGVGFVCFATLPRLPATFVSLLATVCVFLPKASFVQAELAYYALFFASWLLMCRVIHRPDWRLAAFAGLLAGVAFWAKASAWPLVVAFVSTMVLRSLLTHRWGRRTSAGRKVPPEQLTGPATVSSVAVIVFLLVVSPYLRDNRAHFGQYLYNVNSTIFMWCDSWAEARSFADHYDIEHRYPDAPPDQIPSFRRYWRTHSVGQMIRRFGYGLTTLSSLAFHAAYFKYFVFVAILAGFVAWKRRRLLRVMTDREWLVVLFCAVVFVGYMTAFAWYALVAFGDRFVLSMLLPVMLALAWFVARFGRRVGHVTLGNRRVGLVNLVLLLCVSGLFLEGAAAYAYGVTTADETFVRFYFNESREAQLAGDLPEAVRGYQGVLKLDPTFAHAHHELGMIALRQGRISDAVEALMLAVYYRENDPNMLNSLGSALVQAGQLPEAVRALTIATRVDPNFAGAWYNLGGALNLLGDKASAEQIAQRLDTLEPGLARQLRDLIGR